MCWRFGLFPPAGHEAPTGRAKPWFAEPPVAVDDLDGHRGRDVEAPREGIAVRRSEVPGALDRGGVRGNVAATHGEAVVYVNPYSISPSCTSRSTSFAIAVAACSG